MILKQAGAVAASWRTRYNRLWLNLPLDTPTLHAVQFEPGHAQAGRAWNRACTTRETCRASANAELVLLDLRGSFLAEQE